jgi:hypothetical protein
VGWVYTNPAHHFSFLGAKMVNQHPSVELILKKALIDEELIPIVRWINSHDYAFTQHCCQDWSRSYEEGTHPYVAYAVWDKHTEEQINSVLGKHGTIIPKYHGYENNFCLNIRDKKALKELIAEISKLEHRKMPTHRVWMFFKEDNDILPFPWSYEGTEEECEEAIKRYEENGKAHGWTLLYSNVRPIVKDD